MSAPLADCFVSVVAPLRDDAPIVRGFVEDVIGVLRASYTNYELVLVDDGSHDETVDVVLQLLKEQECVRLVRLSREFGEEIAITAGLDSVIGDFVVVMLPNTDPPALIPTFVQKVRTGAGIAFGIRRTRAGDSLLVRIFARLWYLYSGRFLKLRLPRNSSQYRALTRAAVNAHVRIRDRYRYLRMLSADVGYQAAGIYYDEILRNPRRRQRSFLQRVGVTIDIIVSNSTHPLRTITWLGVIASVLNVLYAGYVVFAFVRADDRMAEAWTALSLQSAAMFFFVLVILTVMSEYVGHILVESRDRPLYHVLEEHESPVRIATASRRNVVTESVLS